MSKHIQVTRPLFVGTRHYHPDHDPIAEVDDRTAGRIVAAGHAVYAVQAPSLTPPSDVPEPSSAVEPKPKTAAKSTAKK